REAFALQPAAGDGDVSVLDDGPGHALGGVDGRTDAMLGAVEMGHHAAFEAPRAMATEAKPLELHAFAGNFEPVGSRPGLGDQAADLARAHVKRGDDALPLATIETCLLHPPDPHSGISLGACRRHVRSGAAA